MFWNIANALLQPVSLVCSSAIMIFLGAILTRVKVLLIIASAYVFLALVVAIIFVQSYDSYMQASNHGASEMLVLISCMPLLGLGIGRTIRRVVIFLA
jgi:hypothetical protein